MDLVYFFAVATWVLSGNDAPKDPPAPDVPFNIGYLSIFLCFFLIVITTVVFCMKHKPGEKIPLLNLLIFATVITGLGAGMCFGYDSHVQFLDNWYNTH
jgi:hypothetical protein